MHGRLNLTSRESIPLPYTMAIPRAAEDFPFAANAGNLIVLRKRIKNWAFSHVRGIYVNVHTGWKIRVGRNGTSKGSSHGDWVQLLAFSALSELVKNALLVESHTDRHERPDIVAIHRMYAPFLFKEVLFRVKLTITESEGAFYYDHTLAGIEIETPGRNSRTTAQPLGSQTHPGTVIVPDFLSGVKYEDGTAFVWSR